MRAHAYVWRPIAQDSANAEWCGITRRRDI